MKRLLVLASLIYSLSTNAQSLLLVQSATVNNLYGNAIANALLRREKVDSIDVFHARTFAHDVSDYSRDALKKAVEAYLQQAKPSEVLFVGERPEGLNMQIPSKYTPLLFGADSVNDVALRAASIYNPKWNKVYIVTGPSFNSKLREAEIAKWAEGLEVETFRVSTVLEYRKVLLDLQKQDTGTLVMNVFGLLDEWNQNVGYGELEDILLATNKRHLDVGICRDGFDTTFALGPTPEEAATRVIALYSSNLKSHISSCANLLRLKEKWLPVYRKTTGRFDVVIGGYDEI